MRFSELIERHEREIYRYTYRMLGDPEDAADVLQETFLRAFRAFPKLDHAANHRAWLYRIASRQALNLLRTQRARPNVPLEQAFEVHDPASDVEDAVEGRRLERRLSACLASLSPRRRAALLLRKYDGLAYREVAQALSCTEQTARAHVSQALGIVKRSLRAEGGSE
jgi:RNA polymerase sigma-70 factor (ECF subfamily)